jgi:hypothetical protein
MNRGATGKAEPLLTSRDRGQEEIANYARYGSSSGRTVTALMGVLAFIALLAVAGIGLWRFNVVQEDLTNLDVRLSDVEALLIVHTEQILTLNITLLETIVRVNINTANIASLNATVIRYV